MKFYNQVVISLKLVLQYIVPNSQSVYPYQCPSCPPSISPPSSQEDQWDFLPDPGRSGSSSPAGCCVTGPEMTRVDPSPHRPPHSSLMEEKRGRERFRRPSGQTSSQYYRQTFCLGLLLQFSFNSILIQNVIVIFQLTFKCVFAFHLSGAQSNG